METSTSTPSVAALTGNALLRALRGRVGMSRDDVAAALSRDPVTIWRWEKDGGRLPVGEELRALLDLYRVSAAERPSIILGLFGV